MAEVSLARLAENFGAIQTAVAPAAVMPIVKANAYGHGLVEVARHLAALGATSLGVAFLEEAVALRGAGLDIVAAKRFEGNHAKRLRQKAYPVYAIYRAAGIVVGWFTGGRLGLKETDFFLLASRRSG